MAVITTIRSAFGFLTRLPVGPWPLQNDLNGISAWLPLVGLVVGGLAGVEKFFFLDGLGQRYHLT